MRWVGNAYKVLEGKPERERSLWRDWCRWEDNIKINLEEIGYEGVDWIYMAQVENSGELL
jgi:hypothetical protein